MKSLEDIAKFNVEHADLELPEGSSTRLISKVTQG